MQAGFLNQPPNSSVNQCKISSLYQCRAHPGLHRQGLDKLSKHQLLTGLTWPCKALQNEIILELQTSQMWCHCHGRAQQLHSGARGVWDDPRFTIQVERGDQSCHENSDTLLCHSLGAAVWPQFQMCHWRCCGTKTRRVCSVRLVARSPTPQS